MAADASQKDLVERRSGDAMRNLVTGVRPPAEIRPMQQIFGQVEGGLQAVPMPIPRSQMTL